MRGEDLKQQRSPGGLGWGFGVLAAVIVFDRDGWGIKQQRTWLR